MQVRPARVDDAAAIADAHTRAWQAAYEEGYPRYRALYPALR